MSLTLMTNFVGRISVFFLGLLEKVSWASENNVYSFTDEYNILWIFVKFNQSNSLFSIELSLLSFSLESLSRNGSGALSLSIMMPGSALSFVPSSISFIKLLFSLAIFKFYLTSIVAVVAAEMNVW